MTGVDEQTTDLATDVISGDVLDPEVIPEAERFIGEVDRTAKAVEASVQEADRARLTAELAKRKPAGLGRKQDAIHSLQAASVAASEAISTLAESQQRLFENQRALAGYVLDLKDFALGSVATTRLVYRHLQLKLSDASESELSELAQRELRLVMQEFRRQLDLGARQEQADKKLADLRESLSQHKLATDQALSDAQDEHELFHQAAELANANAARLDAVLEDLEVQRGADQSFNESMQAVIRRLAEVELLIESTTSSLAIECAHGEQRDESIAQLYALAASNHDAAQKGDSELEVAAQSTTATVTQLRGRLHIAVATAVAGLVMSVTALLMALLA